ncbi:HTH-type transcriptional regulator BhcR [Pseudorhodobacter sp.]|uniref:HTH-type transcriptional regulator BhcR n=1 Tax=Pseudorhodobacter sp. TaxID=1934400 RepID=UPI002AFF3E42|nr:HTH-type transcriptional regulator BhcR [Pseudorhodobacter sp.]
MDSDNRNRGRPKKFQESETPITIQAVDRAIDVLEALSKGGALTLSELAKRMDQSPATLYRVLSTFQARGMVENEPLTQEWSVGASAFRIGASFLRRSNVTARALPAMRHLMEATGETSNLGIEKSGMVIFISQVETHESIRAFFPPGTQAPMHSSGIGKALLSTFSDARLHKFLQDGPFEKFTPQTIVTQDGLLSEMQAIRAKGFAFDNEEKSNGMRCIAAPILNFQGQAVAGISISGPSHRVTQDNVAQFGALVKAAAEDVSRSLGAEL